MDLPYGIRRTLEQDWIPYFVAGFEREVMHVIEYVSIYDLIVILRKSVLVVHIKHPYIARHVVLTSTES